MVASIKEYLSLEAVQFFEVFYWQLALPMILYLLHNSPLDNSVFVVAAILSHFGILWFLSKPSSLWWLSYPLHRKLHFLNHFLQSLYFLISQWGETYKMTLIENYLVSSLPQIHNPFCFLNSFLFYFNPHIILFFQSVLRTNSSLWWTVLKSRHPMHDFDFYFIFRLND